MLNREGSGMSSVPTSAQASKRLGWQLTKFNRKLDNVCDKLDRLGVRGLRGGPGKLASNRRARLVEHAVFSRLVTSADLPLLDQSDRKSTRLNSSHVATSYAVCCLKKKRQQYKR